MPETLPTADVTVSLDDHSIERLAKAIAIAVKNMLVEHGESESTTKVESGLIGTPEVASMLNIAPRTVWRLRDGGRLPKPIRIGRTVKWRHDEIVAWINDGCPPRHQWRWKPR